MRDLGSIPAPQNSFILNLGLETLALRVERHCSNAQKVAEFLEKDERVSWVEYPGLESNKYHALAMKYMPHGTSGVISFGVNGGREAAMRFMNSLKLGAIVTHVADARTCLLHPDEHDAQADDRRAAFPAAGVRTPILSDFRSASRTWATLSRILISALGKA